MTNQKFDKEKLRMELIPAEFMEATANGLGYGANKYSPGNWAQQPGFDYSRLYGALLRHLTAWSRGEDSDPESGNHHLDHAACMLCFLICHIRRGLGKDDRVEIGLASLGSKECQSQSSGPLSGKASGSTDTHQECTEHDLLSAYHLETAPSLLAQKWLYENLPEVARTNPPQVPGQVDHARTSGYRVPSVTYSEKQDQY